ncbi:unnamed protein product [Jaminaea pallidilutea]
MVARRSARTLIRSNDENDGAKPAAGSRSALPNKAAVQAPLEEGPSKRSRRLPLASKTNTPSSSDVEGKSGRGGRGSAKVTKQKGAKPKRAESSAVSTSQRQSVSRDGRTTGTSAAAGSKMTGVGAASQPQKPRQSHVAATGTLEKDASAKVAMAKATSPLRSRPRSLSIDSMAEMEAEYVSRDPPQTVAQNRKPASPITGPPRHSTPLQSKQRVISPAPGALLDKEMISPSRLPRQSDEAMPRLIDPYNDDQLNAEKLERVRSYVRTSSQAESSRSHGKNNGGRPLKFERIPSPVIAEQAREATNSGDEDDEFGFFAAARTAKMRQVAGTRPSEGAAAHGMGVARASKDAASAAAVGGDASDEELPTVAGLVERRDPRMEEGSAAMNGADLLRDILGSSASSSSGQDARGSNSDDGHNHHPFYSKSLASKRTDGQGTSKQSSAARSNGAGEGQSLHAEQTGKKWRMEDTLKEVMPRKVAEDRGKSSKQKALPLQKSKSQPREQERTDRRSTSQSKASSSRSLKRQQSGLVQSTPPDGSAPSAVRLRSASSARKDTDNVVPLSRSGRPLRATSKKQDVNFDSSSEPNDSDGLGITKKRAGTSQPLASKGSRSQSSSSGAAQKSRKTSARATTQKRRKVAKSKENDHESSDLWGFRPGLKADADNEGAGNDLDDYSFEEELVI